MLSFEDFLAGWIGVSIYYRRVLDLLHIYNSRLHTEVGSVSLLSRANARDGNETIRRGITGLIIGHPLDTIKVRQQSMGERFLSTIRRTYKHEGFFGFYRGFLAPFLSIGPTNAVFFVTYANSMKLLQAQETGTRVDLNDPHWIRKVGYSGCVAGLAQVIVTCPVELVKTILQTRTPGTGHWKAHYQASYKNTYDAVFGIYGERGIRGFYRGILPMFWRDVPASSIYMVTYENLLPRGQSRPLWQQLGAGGLAGVSSWIFITPFDVVKSRMQSDNPSNPHYKGMIDCFYKSYMAEGPGIFMRGFWLSTVRAFPVNAAILFGYEKTLEIIKKYF